jgi:hypothetical protein
MPRLELREDDVIATRACEHRDDVDAVPAQPGLVAVKVVAQRGFEVGGRRAPGGGGVDVPLLVHATEEPDRLEPLGVRGREVVANSLEQRLRGDQSTVIDQRLRVQPLHAGIALAGLQHCLGDLAHLCEPALPAQGAEDRAHVVHRLERVAHADRVRQLVGELSHVQPVERVERTVEIGVQLREILPGGHGHLSETGYRAGHRADAAATPRHARAGRGAAARRGTTPPRGARSR